MKRRGRPKGGKCPIKLYTVYNNITDMPVIIDGTAEECAKAMGIKLESFYSYVARLHDGKTKKWYIEKRWRKNGKKSKNKSR